MTQAARFHGKTVVVTGAGRLAGLGAAIAARFAGEGASVVISDIGDARDLPQDMLGKRQVMEAVAELCRAAGGAASCFPCDVRDYAQVAALGQHALRTHGTIDAWINNAGVGFIMKPLMEVTPADWSAVIDVNLTGAFFGLRVAAEAMIAAGRGGRIVNIASQAAKSGFIHAQAYTASKHALVGLARSAAVELGPHCITVNNVCPNHVTTGLGAWQNEYFAKVTGHGSVESYLTAMRGRIPLGRPGLPADTAAAVAFLCSEDAAYITGESMNVSGGEETH